MEKSPSFEKLNPLNQRMLCAYFGWNWPSGSGEENESVKSLRQQLRRRRQRQRRRTTDEFWSEKLIWAYESGELTNKHFNSQHWIKTEVGEVGGGGSC